MYKYHHLPFQPEFFNEIKKKKIIQYKNYDIF